MARYFHPDTGTWSPLPRVMFCGCGAHLVYRIKQRSWTCPNWKIKH